MPSRGWTLVQIVNSLFPVLHLPAWTSTFAAVLLLLCFPIALILAWAFEPAADGVKLTEPAGKDASPARWAWADWALAAVVLAVGVVVVLEGAGGRPATVRRRAAVRELQRPARRRVLRRRPYRRGHQQPRAGARASGRGRTSAFYFKGRNEDIRNIGRQLGVAHVLEGSVLRQGERLRVTVQLIKVADGFHLWSETYDRTMGDAFAVQSDIADQVADVLKVKLVSSASATHAADHDPMFLGASFNMLVLTDDFEGARRMGPLAAPDLFTLDPKVDPALSYEAVQAALVFDRLGDHGQAQRILRQLLALTLPGRAFGWRPGWRWHACRRWPSWATRRERCANCAERSTEATAISGTSTSSSAWTATRS
jgi:hypothetical protein